MQCKNRGTRYIVSKNVQVDRYVDDAQKDKLHNVHYTITLKIEHLVMYLTTLASVYTACMHSMCVTHFINSNTVVNYDRFYIIQKSSHPTDKKIKARYAVGLPKTVYKILFKQSLYWCNSSCSSHLQYLYLDSFPGVERRKTACLHMHVISRNSVATVFIRVRTLVTS